MSKGTVTILRRMANPDLIARYKHETAAPCELFADGQVFGMLAEIFGCS